MNSRVDENNKQTTKKVLGSRTERNQDLYKEVGKTEISKIRTNNNIRIIDDQPKEIDIEKIKDYINKLNEDEPKKKKVVVDPVDTGEIQLDEDDEKIYDINAVLEKAKEEKQTTYEEEKHKRLRDTEYDILSKIDLEKEQNKRSSKTFKEEELQPEEELLTEKDVEENEKTLMDLINTVTIAKDDVDLLSELTTSDDAKEEETGTIEEEIKKAEAADVHISKIPNEAKQEIKVIEENLNKKEREKTINDEIDKSFYTNSMSFSKKDFEGFEDLESSVKKNNALVVLAIIILLLVIAFTTVVICNYVFELHWF